MVHTSRSQKGISLPTIVALGVISMMWLIGTAALVMPIGGRVTKERAQDVARSSAEASLDWAIAQLSTDAGRTMYEPAAGGTTTLSVPPSILADPSFKGTVDIFRPAAGAPSYSYLYDAGVDPVKSPNIQGGNAWHVVTASVANPGGNVRRTVRVILKPEYATQKKEVITSVTVTGPPQAIFNVAMHSPGELNTNGQAETNSYNSTNDPNATKMLNGGDVSTNTSFGGSGQILINGDLTVYGDSKDNGGASVVNGSGSSKVNGDITADGAVNLPASGTTKANTSTENPQLPPVPSAPSNASSLGSLSLSGKSTITLGNGYYKIGNTKYTTGNGGNYAVNSIQLSGQAQIIVDNSNGPINVYVGGAGSNAGISMTGQGIANQSGLPGGFRVWYGGTGNVQLSGQGNLKAVVYAPNAPVQVTGQGTIYGAIVGNTIKVGGQGKFLYDEALGKDNSLTWNPPIQKDIPTNIEVQNINYFQAVSWREL